MWNKIPCSYVELHLGLTLKGAQSFRWYDTDKGEYQGVLAGRVWSIKQDDCGNILYKVHDCNKHAKKRKKLELENSTSNYESIIKDYFQLHINLEEYYKEWCKVDQHFSKLSSFKGIRILRQDPVENLVSFICSANNNVPRITSMVEKLCKEYGTEIFLQDGSVFYNFPTLETLADDKVEKRLRELGFGYRAKYINQAAKHITENQHRGWLESLRNVPYKEAHSALVALPGVGKKVADCVCLMSLDKPCAIPVDTHMWQVTKQNYLPHLKDVKSVSSVYDKIGDFYREKFGEYAGWAAEVLFAVDLRKLNKKGA